MAATKSGNTWYTDDAEYTVDGDTIRRGDGSYTVVEADADAVAEELATGNRLDSEFDWSDE